MWIITREPSYGWAPLANCYLFCLCCCFDMHVWIFLIYYMYLIFTDMGQMWMPKLFALHKGHLIMTHHYIWLQGTVIQCVSRDLFRLMPIYGLKIALDLQQKDLWLIQDFGTGWKAFEVDRDHYNYSALRQSETISNQTKQKMLWSSRFQCIFWDKFFLSKISRLYSIKL